MRKYNRRIDVRLTEDEYAVLTDKADNAGVSIAEFFRRLVNEYRFPEKPDPDFVSALMNLSNIGGAIIKITKSDIKEDYDKEQLKRDVNELERIKEELIKKYFSPWIYFLVVENRVLQYNIEPVTQSLANDSEVR